MWLDRVPLGLVRACLAMLPRLQAEELLASSQATAMGSGTLSKRDHAAAVAHLNRIIDDAQSAPRKVSRDALASAGIHLIEESA